MTREEMIFAISEIVKDEIGVDEISIYEDTVAADVDGWDSLVHISIIFDIETRFGIKFSMSEVQNFKNVGEIVDAIEKRTV